MRTLVGFLLAALGAAILPAVASATLISYVVDRTLTFEDVTMTVVGTLTVDDTVPSVTDWSLTITSATLARSATIDSSNSTFHFRGTTLTPTPTQLTIDVGPGGLFGADQRDGATSLRHEWFLLEENGFLFDQASLDFADPDPDADFVGMEVTNPVILFAVPEPGVLAYLAAACAVYAGALRSRAGPIGPIR